MSLWPQQFVEDSRLAAHYGVPVSSHFDFSTPVVHGSFQPFPPTIQPPTFTAEPFHFLNHLQPTFTQPLALSPAAPVASEPQKTASLASLTVSVTSGNDDAEEKRASGKMILRDNDLDIEPSRIVGIRFSSVPLRSNARIHSAHLEFVSQSGDASPCEAVIYGEAADHAAPFTSELHSITSRQATASRVTWKPSGWSKGERYTSADVTSILDEVLRRAGWQQGNAVVFIIAGVAGARDPFTYDADPAKAPKLHVEYYADSAEAPKHVEPSIPSVTIFDLSNECLVPTLFPTQAESVTTQAVPTLHNLSHSTLELPVPAYQHSTLLAPSVSSLPSYAALPFAPTFVPQSPYLRY